MYSKVLSTYTKSAVEEVDVPLDLVSTMHHWLEGYWMGHFRRKPPYLTDYDFNWPSILATLTGNEQGETENLIVDEGQDLPAPFFTMARVISQHLTVFADENQRLNRDANCSLQEILNTALIDEGHHHRLTRNYRNTREIAEFASKFYTGLPTGIPDLPERRGDRPVLMAKSSVNEEVEAIVTHEKNNSDLEIGVFAPTVRQVQKLRNRLQAKATANPVRYYLRKERTDAAALSFDTPGIVIVTYQSAKGLEFDTVFIPFLDRAPDWLDPALPETKMKYYVLASRARNHLFLSHSGNGDSGIVRMMKEALEQ